MRLWVLWLAFALSVVTAAGVLTNAPILVTTIGAIGAAFVVTVAQGLRVAPVLGSLMALGYGYLAYQNQFYGDMTLNWFYHLPLYLAAIYTWSKASETHQKPRELDWRGFLLAVLVFACATFLGALMLDSVGGRSPVFDAASTAAGLLGSFLLWRRYTDQWLFWTIGNSVNSVMWGLRAYEDPTVTPMVVMWLVFTINGLWGWRRWSQQT